MNTILDSIRNSEWYDNHKLAMILNCQRKAFYHLYWQGGLEQRVGPGADFGWCFHSAMAVYNKAQPPEKARRLLAVRAFDTAYKRKFANAVLTPRDRNRLTLDRGIKILYGYWNKYETEDAQFRCVEPELGGAIRIGPQEGDRPDFRDPFWFIFRADGVFERVRTQDWLVKEYKTTGYGVERELMRRIIDRQSTGYAYGLSQFDPERPILGVMVDAILVAVEKLDYKREYFAKSPAKLDSWRAQTINIVQDWRDKCARNAFAPTQTALDAFVQNDEECTSYGLCSYYDLCKFGPTYQLEKYERTSWFPLE